MGMNSCKLLFLLIQTARPEMEATLDNKSRAVANISWNAPNNGDLNYYAISVDDVPS